MTSKTFLEVLEILRSLYAMPDQRIAKCETLFFLASQVKEGCIVELGAYQGCGAIALWYGALAGGNDVKVHTIDAYTPYTGPFGEKYDTSDFEKYLDNIRKAKAAPVLHVSSFQSVGDCWSTPVALLMWDVGMYNVDGDVGAWERHVIPGGIIAMRDTPDFKFFTDKLSSRYIKGGKYERLSNLFDPNITILQKVKGI